MKKLLFISDHGDPLMPLGSKQAGGQNNYVKQLVLALEKEDYVVDVITHWCNDQAPQVEQLGQRSQVIRLTAGQKGFIEKTEMYHLLPQFYKELLETVTIDDYEVIHTHYWLSGIIGLTLKQDYQFKWLHTNHSLDKAKESGTGKKNEMRQDYERQILQQADGIIATTPTEKELILQISQTTAPIYVVPIGVAENFFQAYETSNSNHPYFLYVGRLEQEKGIYVLLKAFKLLLDTRKVPADLTLKIIGGGSLLIQKDSLHFKDKKIHQLIEGMENRIQFLGSKSQEQLAPYFRQAMVTVVPSYYESFGMVAAEAQACGCPVIASKVGGLQNVVKANVTGLHVEKGNAERLAEAMAQFLQMPYTVQVLGLNAQKYARKQFNWKNIAQQMSRLYQEVTT